MMVFESLLDPVLSPVLKLNPLVGILLISILITFIITIIYKYTTNQKEIRRLKKDMKDNQKKLKELSKSDPQKAMVMQKKAMEKNFEYMKHSLKPTLYTFIPIIIIFGWLNAHMAYYPIEPDTSFTVTAEFEQGIDGNATMTAVPDLEYQDGQEKVIENGMVIWKLKGQEGKHTMMIDYAGNSFDKKLIISTERRYEQPEQVYKDSPLKKVITGNQKVRPFGDLSIFGWYPGWLATYIISSMIFSTLLRRLMKLS